jgi:hypothetical protein
MKSKNHTNVNNHSDSEVDKLKNKIETEKPFNDAPNDGKNERFIRTSRYISKLKVGSIQTQQDLSKILIQEGNLYLKRLTLY